MQLNIQYLGLQSALMVSYPTINEIPVTIEEISKLLCCSDRNVKILIKKMIDQGWIEWKPGRGRGNCSRILFLSSACELILQEAKALAQQGNVDTALKLLQTPGVTAIEIEKFIAWLGEYFGYKAHDEQDQSLEILRLPLKSPIITLDPVDVFIAQDFQIVRQIYETLTRFDPLTKTVVPHLAHYWEINESATIWTYYLRKDVLFHHGRTMTAQDVVFSFLRIKEKGPTSWNGWLAEEILDVRKLSKLVFQVELTKPNYMFHHFTSSSSMSIIPMDIHSIDSDLNLQPVGTGPFQITRKDEGSLVLEAFRDYFRERPHLDRIEMLHVPWDLQNEKTKKINYHMGNYKLIQNPAPSSWKSYNTLPIGCSYLAFNLRKLGPQQDSNFREAIHRVLNRRQMITELGMEGALPAEGFLPPLSLKNNFNDDDLFLAKELIKNSNYHGETVKLVCLDGYRDQSEWIKKRCDLLGIQIKIIDLSGTHVTQTKFLLENDIKVGKVLADDDIDRCILELYKLEPLVFRSYSTDAFKQTLDQAIAKVFAEPDPDIRCKQIMELEQLIKVDHKVLFLAHISNKTMYSPDVQGVSINTLGGFDFKDIWFKA